MLTCRFVFLLCACCVATLASGQEKPDSPKPKVASQMSKGERDVYLSKKYPDLLQIDRPAPTFKEAATGRGMLIFESLFVLSNIADEEGTQRCIHAGTCYETNKLFGQSRAQAYAVGGALAAAVIVSAVELRKRQHGSMALLLLWAPTTIHTVLAVKGYRDR